MNSPRAARTSAPLSAADIAAVHAEVFRRDLEHPGFAYRNLGRDLDSRAFRRCMVDLVDGLMSLSEASGERLGYRWVGRFDHQHSSMFHRDNADPRSVLILGYEPTEVDSVVSVGDYSRLLADTGRTIEDYFGGHPDRNVAEDDDALEPYATTLDPFEKDTYRLLVLDNSKSFDEPTLGVFHRGRIDTPIEGTHRVVNSIMLTIGGAEQAVPQREIDAFVASDELSG